MKKKMILGTASCQLRLEGKVYQLAGGRRRCRYSTVSHLRVELVGCENTSEEACHEYIDLFTKECIVLRECPSRCK